MIIISRAVARSFRSLLRRSVIASSPRGIAPPVLASVEGDTLTLRAAREEVGLTLRTQSESVNAGQIAFPGHVLARIDGSGTEAVTLEVLPDGQAQARWDERGVPQVAEFAPVDPDEIPPLPAAGRRLTSMAPGFVKALDEVCRTAGQQAIRFELGCILLRGKTGELVGTDGRQLLVQGGWRLPFGADVLVPALPVFAAKELANTEPALLGRADGRLLLRAGPWCLDLQIDAKGRFPNYEQVIPAGSRPTRLMVSEADAHFLMEALPGLPAADEDFAPVTLDLGEQAWVRSRSEAAATEVLLGSSRVTGRPIRVSVQRRLLIRALRLGFRSVELHAADKPVVARDQQRLMVFVTVDPTQIVEPSPGMIRLTTPEDGIAPVNPSHERTPPMAISNNGNGANGHQAEPSDAFDPLAEAEALKAALQEALNRSSRLIAGMRQFRKQHKAVASAMASLRQFQLTP
jgi:hypothetical protein